MRHHILLIINVTCFIGASNAQQVKFSRDGKQQEMYSDVRQKIALPKEVCELSNNQIVFRKVSAEDNLISMRATIDISKYYRLDSTRKADNCILINLTSKPLSIPTSMHRILGLREVIVDKIWTPLEWWTFPDCSTGDYPYSLLPGQMVLIRKKRVSGSIAGKMRFRLLTCNQPSKFIYSDQYEGSYDTENFYINFKQAPINEPFNRVYLLDIGNWVCDEYPRKR